MNEKTDVISTTTPEVKENKVEEVANEKIDTTKVSLKEKLNVEDPQDESYYDGRLLDMWALKTLRGMLTPITLGGATPFVDTLCERYHLKHTVINGKRLSYEGEGLDLFIENFRWNFFKIVTLGIYKFWARVRRRNFIDSNTTYKGHDLIEGNSYFDGTVGGLFGVNVLVFVITTLTLGLLYPFALCYKEQYMQRHRVINGTRFKFDGTGFQLIGKWLLWMLLSVVTLGIFAIWIPIKKKKWIVSHIKEANPNETETQTNKIVMIVAIAIAAIMFIVGIILAVNKVNSIIPKSDPSNADPAITEKVCSRKEEVIKYIPKYGSSGEELIKESTHPELYRALEDLIDDGATAYIEYNAIYPYVVVMYKGYAYDLSTSDYGTCQPRGYSLDRLIDIKYKSLTIDDVLPFVKQDTQIINTEDWN